MSGPKLIARLREHDWLSAVIELVIVVAGILLALQVNNWNQDRIDRSHADGYYRRIHAELLADRQGMDDAFTFWGAVSVYADAAMAHSERGELRDGSAWKTVLAYYQAGQLMPFELEDTTFREMRDGGYLGLIVDERLRKRLADYYRLSGSGIRSGLLHHDPVYRMQIRGLTPWHVQQYVWDHCFKQLEGARQELIDCPSPIGDAEASTLLGAYRQSDTLLQNLRIWQSTLKVSTLVIDYARKDADRLAAEVDAAWHR